MHHRSRLVRIALTVAACSLLLLPVDAAERLRLQAPDRGDIAAAATVATDAVRSSAGAAGIPREAVSATFPQRAALATPQPFEAVSREYSLTVSGAQLNEGVTLSTNAPGALVRIQPLPNAERRQASAIQPAAVTLIDAEGRAFAEGSGMQQLAAPEKLAQAELPFPDGTSAFRLDASLGAGSILVRADDLVEADRYAIHVLDVASPWALALRPRQDSYLHGDSLIVDASLLHADGSRQAWTDLQAVVVSPTGRRFPLRFSGSGRSAVGQLTLDANEAPHPGLWEIQAQGTIELDGQPVIRGGRVAFDVAMPVARLASTVAVERRADALRIGLDLDVAAAGRYEVRGVLYGMQGKRAVPVAVAHAADWIEPGQGSLTLQFERELLDGISGPFELRDLRLLDQGRMGVLHRQQRALTIEVATAPRR